MRRPKDYKLKLLGKHPQWYYNVEDGTEINRIPPWIDLDVYKFPKISKL